MILHHKSKTSADKGLDFDHVAEASLPDATSPDQYFLYSGPPLIATTLRRLGLVPQDVEASRNVEALIYECIQRLFHEYDVRSSRSRTQNSNIPIIQDPVPQLSQHPEVSHLRQLDNVSELLRLQTDETTNPLHSRDWQDAAQDHLANQHDEAPLLPHVGQIRGSTETLQQDFSPELSELTQVGDILDYTGVPQKSNVPMFPELPQLDNMTDFTQLPAPHDVSEFSEFHQHNDDLQPEGLDALTMMPDVTQRHDVDNMPNPFSIATTTTPYSNLTSDASGPWFSSPLTSNSAYLSDSAPWDPSVYTATNVGEWCICRCHDLSGLDAELCGGCC